ncbi:hypothetical protein IO90_05980 [Chryseobacterium sp. FH1]|nr:hypothetical protein IO90_05980 [Chryseobacterium sp. FH1]
MKNFYYDKAFVFREVGKSDSAFQYFDKAKNVFLEKHDSADAGRCLVNMAIIQEQFGDNYGGLETGISALKYFNDKDSSLHNYLSINYNTLGILSSKLTNYNKAIEFYEKAILFSKDSVNKNLYTNNLANNYRRNKDYNVSIKILSTLLNKNKQNTNYKSRILDNLAFTKWTHNAQHNPLSEFQEALKIRLKDQDNWGLNSSYSHLSDYYAKKNQDSALVYARKMFAISKEIKSPDDQIEALQKLISLEDANNSKQYFKVYQKMNDSLQTARNKAKNQFALIRYETEKNKADFLKAKAESTERQNHIIKQYVALAFALITIIGFILYLKKRKKIHQQEKLLEVKNTELKYSKKVHDRVANRIYQILSQVENKEHIDRDSLLFGLENVYETSRDISYENEEINENQNYFEQLQSMLDSYSSDAVQVIFHGNNEKLWEGVNFQIRTEVYLILQELMTNMKKHSQADKVFLKFTNESSHINISYTDNGVGIKTHSPKNGLQNMENRINSINGKINFDTETNNLLKINISFPI